MDKRTYFTNTMLSVKFICTGKMREKYFIGAFEEYEKRLRSYCKFELAEPTEVKLPDAPSDREIQTALEKEAAEIEKAIPAGAYTVAMCIEGEQFPSEGMARLIERCESSGRPRLCFIVGGSYGLAERIKRGADMRLSMSKMTFPHHLARVMLIEQVYRGFKIREGSRYHK